MNKLQLTLRPNDVHQLSELLQHVLTGSDINELKKHRPEVYLKFSCLTDFFNKLDSKSKEIFMYGVKPGTMYKISMKRHEALAFFLLTNEKKPEESLLPALPGHVMNRIDEIRGDIHKQYLI